MYNKQQWLDEIPDMSRPILDGSGKQKTDPQTGRPLFELVQAGTRITSARLNNMEGGIEGAHILIEQLTKELAGNFVAVIDGVMGLQCSTQGLTASWTAGVAYVGGRRLEVPAGNMTLNPTQGQYLYVDTDGIVKKTTSQATAKAGVLLFYVATDTSGVITSTDQRVNISLEEILARIENIDVPDASLTQKGITQLSSATDSTSEAMAATPKAVKAAYDRGSAGVTAAATAQSRADSAYSEATAAKQLGVEQKANVVAALNSIGVPASTSESWAQLIPKISAIIRATGNATAADLLAGKSASNASGPFNGSMPNRSAENHHMPGQDMTVWAGDRVFISPPRGYYDGSSWVTAPATGIKPENLRDGVSFGPVIGNLKTIGPGDKMKFFEEIGPLSTFGTSPGIGFGCVISMAGTYRVQFYLGVQDGFIGYGQIYVNGTPRGTLRSVTSSYIGYIEDITINGNDKIQVYVWTNKSGGYVHLRDFKVSTNIEVWSSRS